VGAGAALVRLPRALTDPFWQDEVASARILREPTLTGVVRHVARTESTPPLWYLIGWLTHRLGLSIHDVRLLSVVTGGLLATATVLLARGLVGRTGAALAGVLVAVGGELVAAGRELRAYELLALMAVLFALALDAAVRDPSRRHLAALGISTVGGVMSHYFFAFTLAAGVAWLWFEPAARRARRRATLAIAGGLVLAAPWLPEALDQYRQNRFSWIGPFDGRVVTNTAFRLFTPLVRSGLAARIVPSGFLALALLGALLLARSSARGRLCATLAFGPLALAAVAWLLGVRVYADRNMIGIGAFIATAFAAAIAGLPVRARAAALAAVATVAVAGFASEQLTPSAPYSGIAHALVAEGWNAADPVLVFGSSDAFRSPLEWYLPRAPSLTVLRRSHSECRIAYVVAGRRAARIVAEDVVSGRRVGRFLVARIRLDGRENGGSLLATPAAQARCRSRAVSS
jgi:4-amino-4-deoxy-L-arabinose transferase-like glycosyltransferase